VLARTRISIAIKAAWRLRGKNAMAGTDTNPNVRTLYDDWQARRQRLAGVVGGDADYRAVELRLLDYLLRRYRASPEAARPARFPLPTSVFVNHRAIVVHHHLGRGVIPTISSKQEAQAHVRAIVERMQTPVAAAEAAGSDQAVARWLIPPEDDPVETARMNLCDADPAERVHAALELGESGDLDDIGLLSDLLALPIGADELPREREALLYAMQRLSGGSTEAFDLSGILPLPRHPAAVVPRHCDGAGRIEVRRDLNSYRFLLVLALLFVIGVFVGMLLGSLR
jgi:hypothetical protein